VSTFRQCCMADGSSVPRNEGGKEFEMLIMCAGYERKRPPGDGIVRAVESEPPIVPWCEAKTRSSAGAKGNETGRPVAQCEDGLGRKARGSWRRGHGLRDCGGCAGVHQRIDDRDPRVRQDCVAAVGRLVGERANAVTARGRAIHKLRPFAETTSARKKCSDPHAQLRQELSFKPGIALQPWRIARRGMWQWDIPRSVLPPRLGRFSQ
jgi:hypothetical protein